MWALNPKKEKKEMEMHKVGDYLTTKYVSFSRDMPVVEAARKLLKNELIGGPVIDENKKLKQQKEISRKCFHKYVLNHIK